MCLPRAGHADVLGGFLAFNSGAGSSDSAPSSPHLTPLIEAVRSVQVRLAKEVLAASRYARDPYPLCVGDLASHGSGGRAI